MVINHNLMANNATRSMNTNSANASKSMQKLSSGLRINSAADDAAGLSISEKMRAQIRGLDQASANAQDAISMVQTAEGALGETTSILQRMRELANQAANGTNTTADRSSMQDEINQLTSEINRIGNTTEFNTQKILNGGLDSSTSGKITKGDTAEKVLGLNVGGFVGATHTLNGAAQAGKVVDSQAATATLTIEEDDVGAGGKITVDGVDFSAASVTFTDVTTNDAATNSANKAKLDDLTAVVNGKTVKLSDYANITVAGDQVNITSKSSAASSVQVTKGTAAGDTGFSADVTKKDGHGVAAKVGNDVFELGGTDIKVATEADKAATIKALGNITATGGTTKLSDVANIEFDSNGKLKFTTKLEGGAALAFLGEDDSNLGFDKATDTAAIPAGTAATAGKVGAGVSVTVDNTTFSLTGLELDPSKLDDMIEKIGKVTSGGTKLSDLVDIEVKDDSLKFTTKSTGTTSTIQFTGTDTLLGIAAGDAGAANAVKGSDTTVERAGLEAANALSNTSDISIAKDATFKVVVGKDSAVTVNLNTSNSAKVYNTSNTDANVSKAAMQDLVKDINSSLQEAGLSGKVSASLSSDNKIQFISETGQDIKVSDGTDTPLANGLGFTAASMTDVKNVDQVVGPGVQGGGYSTTFQIGANKGQSMSLSINDMRSAALGITGNAGQKGFTATNGVTNGTTDVMQEAALNVVSKQDATKSLDVLDKAIATVSAERGKLGAVQNRLEHTIANLGTSSENLTSAESRIRDVDMAKEMSTYSKNNILSQAAQAMLTQANQNPQQVLQLLR